MCVIPNSNSKAYSLAISSSLEKIAELKPNSVSFALAMTSSSELALVIRAIGAKSSVCANSLLLSTFPITVGVKILPILLPSNKKSKSFPHVF